MSLHVGPGDLLSSEARRAGGTGSGGVRGLGLEVDDRTGGQSGVCVYFLSSMKLLVHSCAVRKRMLPEFSHVLDLDVEVGFKRVFVAVERGNLRSLGLDMAGRRPLALFVLDVELVQGSAHFLMGHLK